MLTFTNRFIAVQDRISNLREYAIDRCSDFRARREVLDLAHQAYMALRFGWLEQANRFCVRGECRIVQARAEITI